MNFSRHEKYETNVLFFFSVILFYKPNRFYKKNMFIANPFQSIRIISKQFEKSVIQVAHARKRFDILSVNQTGRTF